MSRFSDQTNCGKDFRTYYLGSGTATAGGTGDNTAATTGFVGKKTDLGEFRSGKVVIGYKATLAAAATLSFAVTPKDASEADGSDKATYDYAKAIAPTIVATGPTGGGTVTDTIELDVDFSASREFVGAEITPDLSAAGVDTLSWTAVLVMGGGDRGPVSKTLA